MTGHGGDIYGFIEQRGKAQGYVIDFSTSINPLGTPGRVVLEIKKALKNLIHYPDMRATKLTDKIAGTLNVDPKSIVCGNGSTELIYLVPRAMGFRRVLIPQPTFSDYGRACKLANPACTVTDLMLGKYNNFDIEPDVLINETINIKPDAVFLCNPNNPTGRLIKKETLLYMARQMKKRKTYLIVDESFIDFCPGSSVANEVERNPYLIVLKSMTKFYALAGLRLGYGIFPIHIAEMLKDHKEPWTVNTLAQAAGIAALNENDFKERTVKFISRQKKLFEKGFGDIGMDYIPSCANFYLLCTSYAQRIAECLSHRGVMIRDCSNFKGLDHRYVRIAVKLHKENMLLLKYIQEDCVEQEQSYKTISNKARGHNRRRVKEGL